MDQASIAKLLAELLRAPTYVSDPDVGSGTAGIMINPDPTGGGLILYSDTDTYDPETATGTYQVFMSIADGKIYAGAGSVVIGSNGIKRIGGLTAWDTWNDGTNDFATIGGNVVSNTNILGIVAFGNATNNKAQLSFSTIAHGANEAAVVIFTDTSGSRVGIGTSTGTFSGLLVGANPYTGTPGAVLDVRGSAIFNESGSDADFRIEGDTATHLIFADASADRVGINNNTPTVALDVVGAGLFSIGVTVNESGADSDFRVEGDSSTHLIFADASADVVGIATSTPSSSGRLQVAKDFTTSTGFGQIEAVGATNNAKRMTMGFDTTNDRGFLQASETSVAFRPLLLNPGGGNVGVGVNGAPSSLLQVGGTIEIDGALDHDGTTIGFYGVTPTARSSAYAATNVTTDRAFDADTVAIAELADVVGTLLADLKLTGIIA